MSEPDVLAEVKAALAKLTPGVQSIEADRYRLTWYAGRDNEHHGYNLFGRIDRDECSLRNAEALAALANLAPALVERCEQAEQNAAAWELTAAGNREDAERLAEDYHKLQLRYDDLWEEAKGYIRQRDEERQRRKQAEALVAEALRLLSPVCVEETLLGAIRNLQQAHLSEKGNATTAEASYQEAQLTIAGLEAERDHARQAFVRTQADLCRARQALEEMTAKRDALFEDATVLKRGAATLSRLVDGMVDLWLAARRKVDEAFRAGFGEGVKADGLWEDYPDALARWKEQT